jgi:hypothetical protein
MKMKTMGQLPCGCLHHVHSILSLVQTTTSLHQQEADKKKMKMRECACSFHLDLSELDLNNTSKMLMI